MKKNNLRFRLLGYINSFLASSFLILLFKRELNNFDYSLWGILTSLTLIFSIITQFTMPNMIEKDFIDLTKNKKVELMLIYFKYLAISSPLIYTLIFVFYNLNLYFYSYKYTIPLLIALLIFVENSINLINKILITKKESWIFDKVELFIVKYLRLIVFIFYFLLNSEISFLVVLTLHFFTRLTSLVLLLLLKKNFDINFRLVDFKNLKIKTYLNNLNSNLNNFLINLAQFFFYNFIYISSSYFFEVQIYANFSLYFIVFIFCRNFFDAFANLKTPEIKKDYNFIKLRLFEKDYFLYSVLIVLTFLLIIELIFNYNLYNYFGNLITAESSKYISIAILHGFLTGIYSFRHYFFKFDNKNYKIHLIFYFTNITFNGILYFLLIQNLNAIYTVVIVLILYELINIIFYYHFFKRLNNKKQVYSISFSFLLLLLSLYVDNFFFYLLVFLISLIELINYKAKLK